MSSIQMISVSTVPASVVPAGMLQVTARTRSTTDKATGKKTEVPLHARSRSILIPEFSLPAVPSKFASLVSEALTKLAQQQLAAAWEAQPELLDVQAAAYSLDALLLYAAREAESRKLNADSISTFWEGSQLRAAFTLKYTPAQIARFKLELINIAAPVISSSFYNEDKALRRIVTLASHEADAESPVCAQMIAKLQRYVDRLQAQQADIGSVEEIDA